MATTFPTPQTFTINDTIHAHLTLAVANGYYVADMLRRNHASAQDAAIVARVAFHHAATYRELNQWATTSKFARPNDPIAEA